MTYTGLPGTKVEINVQKEGYIRYYRKLIINQKHRKVPVVLQKKRNLVSIFFCLFDIYFNNFFNLIFLLINFFMKTTYLLLIFTFCSFSLISQEDFAFYNLDNSNIKIVSTSKGNYRAIEVEISNFNTESVNIHFPQVDFFII